MEFLTEQKLNRIWYGVEPPALWLRALVPLYRAANGIHRWLATRRRPRDLEAAYIIVVGNLTAGGVGKTPLVVRLCRLLGQAGFRPGVVSRGYGREERGLRLVGPDSDPRQVGDEPVLIANQAGVPVIVAADRCAAARKLLETGVDVIVADDGLQHYALARELEENKVSHEMITYGGAPHAFTVFGSNRYREDADKKSWQRFTEFLKETLD